MLNVTRETKATLAAKNGGRVLAWHNDKERGTLSVAVPGDRARLTPVEARNLAAWLIDAAKAIETPDHSPLRTAMLRTEERVSRW
ncbi:hypothetical protein OHA38_20340 [Streptomyces sp. NBC_01732]|uniref:hypothetical protein n=1 Tax=unclassified Streptomyces TaxID=2593676 RepID=UPI001661EFCA|nr:hypothetical protein [Streptomyces sp. CBMA370]MBD0712575.1 hypothetical protein [Streptomyces sp. CBMA370]WSG51957.1 hypothetical protein OHA38_20340 [Streptomyces sp. NBC_01732]